MTNNLALQPNIYDLLDSYDAKVEALPKMYEAAVQAQAELKNVASLMGAYSGHSVKSSIDHQREYLQSLKKSAWRHMYKILNIEKVAPKTHLKRFENLLEDPPEFNEEHLIENFKDYVLNRREMVLLAMAEIFSSLDPYFKSHDNMKIGVKGLPKRVVIKGCGGYGRGGAEKIYDLIRALQAYRGKETDPVESTWSLKEDIQKEGTNIEGLTFKLFLNGNCHIHFDKNSLRDINLALAEYYGDVLPDAYEHTDKKSESTEVSKDLQFYRTPSFAARRVTDEVYLSGEPRILEPSCGDGALLDTLQQRIKEEGSQAKVIGVEVDPGRVEMCREKGHTVIQANFLDWESDEKFDYVVMNPPFYGKHYQKHVRKAMSHLKEGGKLRAILPVTAQVNHPELSEEYDCYWRDLPTGSFAESGTRINTVILEIKKSTPYERGISDAKKGLSEADNPYEEYMDKYKWSEAFNRKK